MSVERTGRTPAGTAAAVVTATRGREQHQAACDGQSHGPACV